ncbi:hypothetical protein W470_02740, partial [Staphylococcus aureus VET0159R]
KKEVLLSQASKFKKDQNTKGNFAPQTKKHCNRSKEVAALR